ncbi:MAG TPA: DUF262 domain-containing HNH endonuclease family protein [Stenomitos sp.]
MGRTNSSLLNTDTEDLKELLSNGKLYEVPPYQRDYSWKTEQWEDLWEDIRSLYDHDNDHYMGAIVLQSGDRKKFRIIDGQQRIATLSILVLASISCLRELQSAGIDAESNGNRANLLESAFIGSKDPVSLRVVSKLRLNEHDNKFYQLNLSQLVSPAGGVRNLSDSERLMWECFLFFKQKLRDYFHENLNGESIAAFINEIVSERLLFISVRVQDELSAYTVFETLNARGLELTETDLLKNYLLSLADRLSKGQMEPLLHQWNRITDLVGNARLPEFLRHHLNSLRPYVRQKELFKILSREVIDMQDVFKLLRSLEVDAAWYQALGDHNDPFWLDYPGAKEHVRVLNLFSVKQYIPLVLAAKDLLNATENVEVLRYCAVISVRFNGVSRRSTHILEEVYNRASLALRRGEAKNLAEVRRLLAPIYIPDEEFESDFSTLSLKANGKSGKRLRYILCQLEKQLEPKELNDETAQATIEHILPENPTEARCNGFSEADQERFRERLGNYTLLEKTLNSKDAANKCFEDKLPIYMQSRYFMTKNIGYDKWSPDVVQERQRYLAKQAKTVWKLEIPS